MKLYNMDEVIGSAVYNIRKPAVHVCNHDVEDAVMLFVREVNKRYDPALCRRLIDNTFDEGLVTFDTVDEAVEFYSIFEVEGIMGSGLMATMYDSYGNRVSTNI